MTTEPPFQLPEGVRLASPPVYGNPKTIRELQVQVSEWSARNFGGGDIAIPALGFFEEAGELARCIVKMEQGIRGTREEWLAEAANEIGDNLIKLVDIAARLGLDAHDCVWDRWADGPKPIRERDWVANKQGHGLPS